MTMNEAIDSLTEEELDLLNSDPEMLAAFKAKFSEGTPALKTDLTPSTENANVTEQGKEVRNPLSRPGEYVEAGGAGIADVLTGKGLPQAASTVENVLEGIKPETTSGKIGKFAGSFFTPTQIALQAAGAKLAPAVVKGLGKGVTAAGEVLAPKTEVAIPAGQKLASEVLGTVTGAEPEALQMVMANAEAVAKAPTYPVLAKEVAGTMGKLGDKIGEATKVANATLQTEQMLPTEPILQTIQKSIDEIGSQAIPANKVAKETLEALAEQIKVKFKEGTMSQPEVIDWIKKTLRAGINPDDPAGKILSAKLTTIQGITNDMVKAANPAYAKAEESVSDLINLRDSLAESMGMVKKFGRDWDIKNVSVAKLKSLLKPENVAATKEILDRLAKVPGMRDFVQAVKLTAAKESINAPATGVHKLFGLGKRLPALGGVLAGLVPSIPKIATNVATKATQAAIPAVNAIYQGLRD